MIWILQLSISKASGTSEVAIPSFTPGEASVAYQNRGHSAAIRLEVAPGGTNRSQHGMATGSLIEESVWGSDSQCILLLMNLLTPSWFSRNSAICSNMTADSGLYATRIEQNSFLHDVQNPGCQSPQSMTLESKSSLFPSSRSLCTSAYLRLDVAREGLAVLLSTPLSNASCWIWNVRYQCCCQPHVVNDWRSFPSRSLVDELQEPSLCVRCHVASQIIQTIQIKHSEFKYRCKLVWLWIGQLRWCPWKEPDPH